jgi:predicted glycosyltransferase
MKIWVDLATPPQVLFFRPIVAEMAQLGHEVTVTARDFSQTIALAEQCGLQHTVLGYHGGNSLVGKAVGIMKRAIDLTTFAKAKDFDLATSHNSYAQAIAAAMLRLPLVTLMDYEGQPANHIAFRLAQRVIVPEVFPLQALRRYGAADSRVKRFSGIKEDIYLADFVPDLGFPAKLGLSNDRVIATMRPPATMATYHRFENPLFDQLLEYCLSQPQVTVVLLPRVKEQAAELLPRHHGSLIIPDKAVDGPNLIHYSDLVISGGGTMNREAVVLGTPTFTVFKGQMGAVDQHLVDVGRLVIIAETADFRKIGFRKKSSIQGVVGKPSLQREVTDMILEVGNSNA